MSKKKWFQRLGLFAEHNVYTDSNLERQINIIQSVNPSIIQGFGSCLSMLASKIIEASVSIPTPRLIFTDSELLTDQVRHTIISGFNAQVLDVYGTFETDNIAYECNKHKGYHIASDCVIMEFIKDGKQVAPGEDGEIVCTVLHNYTMPFIRYNLNDIGRYTNEKCSCGRTLPLMEMIGGRSDDFAVYENGVEKSPRSFLGLFDDLVEFLHEYQIIQGKNS